MNIPMIVTLNSDYNRNDMYYIPLFLKNPSGVPTIVATADKCHVDDRCINVTATNAVIDNNVTHV